jgi:hypothetical protein
MDKMPDITNRPNEAIEKERKKQETFVLAIELGENQEIFPFPGIDPEAYVTMKNAEKEFPGYTTPIDELITRFKNEGIKVVLGKDPDSGNVFILPGQSNDIENDGIFPKYFQISEIMDEKLKKLILMKGDSK